MSGDLNNGEARVNQFKMVVEADQGGEDAQLPVGPLQHFSRLVFDPSGVDEQPGQVARDCVCLPPQELFARLLFVDILRRRSTDVLEEDVVILVDGGEPAISNFLDPGDLLPLCRSFNRGDAVSSCTSPGRGFEGKRKTHERQTSR